MMFPSRWVWFVLHINAESHGWIRCPVHGYQYDPLKHGYHGPFYYRKCPVLNCYYYVDMV